MEKEYNNLIKKLGNEFYILLRASVEDINKVASDRNIVIAILMVIAINFLVLYLSVFIIRLGDVGVGGLFIVYIAILALIIFFIRSITARYEFVTNAENIEITRLPSGTNKFLVYGLVIFIIVSVVLIMGWLYLPLFLR